MRPGFIPPPPAFDLSTPPYPMYLDEALLSGYTLLSVDMPDADYIEISTTPYPVVWEDAADSNFSAIEGRVIVQPEDALDSFFGGVLNGTLRDIVVTYVMQPEAVESNYTALSGFMKDIVVPYAMQPEAIESNYSPLSGFLKVVVITYAMQPEAIESNFSALGGTLV